jgi:hypothetical protein
MEPASSNQAISFTDSECQRLRLLRGWFPINFLLVEALQKFHHYPGDGYNVECPTGSGRMMTLWEVAAEISQRLTRVFLEDARRATDVGISCTTAL